MDASRRAEAPQPQCKAELRAGMMLLAARIERAQGAPIAIGIDAAAAIRHLFTATFDAQTLHKVTNESIEATATVIAAYLLGQPRKDDRAWVEHAIQEMLAQPAPASVGKEAVQKRCTCGATMGHTRTCAAFDDSTMRYEPFGAAIACDAAIDALALPASKEAG
ncbi:hypothetical protein LMG26411_06936 [Cupriavidus numazuensis]|uniref:Uncharacterized protein n=2 Tax=Cupriavidus numazuensis TaxID=221992 RepID=A0ABN7Q8S6_9BURK|nr:hypothetical protein LMG26411_06936 [Cupriavidus numazuensis]